MRGTGGGSSCKSEKRRLSQIADKHRWFAALRDMGIRTIRLQQLSVHHGELALLGLDR